MSDRERSLQEEFSGVLWFILATQVTYKPIQIFCIGMGVIGMIAGLIYAFKSKMKKIGG